MSLQTHFQSQYDLLCSLSNNAFETYRKQGLNTEMGYSNFCVAAAYATSAHVVDILSQSAGVKVDTQVTSYDLAKIPDLKELYADEAKQMENEIHDLKMERKYERA